MTLAHGLAHPKYRADIDGLRAVAVLSVVGYHAFPGRVTGDFIGVDIFFVISGYLISTIILESLEAERFSFAEFYARRIRRIFPALLVVLCACLAAGWLVMLAGEFRQLGEHVLAGAAFISNLLLWRESGYFDPAAESKPLLHLWSLGIEEQFYIVWPLLLWAAARARMNLLLVAIAIAATSFALNVWRITSDPVATFYSPLTRFWELLAGGLLAWVTVKHQPIAEQFAGRYRSVFSVFGMLCLGAGLLMINNKSAFPGWWALLPVAGSVLLIAAGPNAWINRTALSGRPLVWFGLISFPLYLWHWPMLSFAYIVENEAPTRNLRVLAVAAAILLSWVTYRWIERPVRQNSASRQICGVLIALMCLVGIIATGIRLDGGVPGRQVVIENAHSGQEFEMGSNPQVPCSGIPEDPIASNLCVRYSTGAPRKTIVLWGDSSAGAWLPVFRDFGKRENVDIVSLMHLSCPPILEARKSRFDVPEAARFCADGKTQRKVIDYIRNLEPDAIVLLGAWNSYSSYSNREFVTDQVKGDADAKSTARVMSERLPQTLRELSDIAPTLVFTSWPQMPSMPNYRNISKLGHQARPVYVSRDEFDADSKGINEILASARSANIQLFDPSRMICDTTRCDSVRDGVHYYIDRYHVTAQGAMQLRPTLDIVLEQALGR